MSDRPAFLPPLIALLVAGAVLFVAEATWLRVVAAVALLLAAAVTVFAVATPEFVAADRRDRDSG
jgi:hypothetical protein